MQCFPSTVLVMYPTSVGIVARLALARITAAGLDPSPLLRKVGLTASQIQDRQARVNAASQITFLNLVADALADELLGFHLAEAFELRSTSPVCAGACDPLMVLYPLPQRTDKCPRLISDGLAGQGCIERLLTGRDGLHRLSFFRRGERLRPGIMHSKPGGRSLYRCQGALQSHPCLDPERSML